MEDAELVGLEGTNSGMHESSIMEDNEVLLLPIVWIYELFVMWGTHEGHRRLQDMYTVHVHGAQLQAVASCKAARGLEQDH